MRARVLAALLLTTCSEPMPADDGEGGGTAGSEGTAGSDGTVGSDGSSTGATEPGTTTSDDADASSGSTTGDPGAPMTEPTMAELTLPFWVDAAGAGSLHVGDIELQDGWGSAVIDGSWVPMIAYERQPWPDQGYILYQALAVAEDRWYALWLYCSGGSLTDLYIEGTAGPALTPELASGTCDGGMGDTTISADLPGTTFALLYQGEPFTVEGPDVGLVAGELGRLGHEGVEWVAAPFETVDCTDCDDVGGWYELHMILWDPATERACFSIAYLRSEDAVRFTYTVCLPDLSDPIGDIELPASWQFG